MLSESQLQAIMPGLPASKRAAMLPFLQAAMSEFDIEAPARQAAFLAQLAHESGELRFMEELWGPTPAQRRYEPPGTLAATLGNTEAGDGKRYKGRGPIQITGRANYQQFGDLLQVDLVSDPPRAAVPDLAFRIAGLFWSKKGLNELADQASGDAFREITRRINGGFNGLPERERFYGVACTTLNVSPSTAPGSRGRARPGAATIPKEPLFERGAEAIEAVRETEDTPGKPPRGDPARRARSPQKPGPPARRQPTRTQPAASPKRRAKPKPKSKSKGSLAARARSRVVPQSKSGARRAVEKGAASQAKPSTKGTSKQARATAKQVRAKAKQAGARSKRPSKNPEASRR